MIRLHLFSALACALCAPLFAGTDSAWHTDYDRAREVAREHRIPLLLVFTGSDWCTWCQKLESELLGSVVFERAANESFVAVRLDFPHRVHLPIAEQRQNRRLREQWSVESFPTVILADPFNESALLRHGYVNVDPDDYVRSLAALTRPQGDV